MARILVTGANGFVGSHLVEHLISAGHDVTCLVRKTSNMRWIEKLPVRFVHGEVSLPGSLPPAIEGQEYVIHNAGATRAWNARGYFEINALGTLNMLRACAAGRAIKKFVLVSSQAAAGPSPDGTTVTEEMPPRPVSDYGRSKLMAEKIARGFKDTLPIAIVRPTDVYGPRDRDGLYFFRDALRHLGTVIGFRPAKLIATYVTDVVAGIALAAASENSAGRTYFIASDQVHTWEEVIDEIAAAVGRRVFKLRIHGKTVRMLGRYITALAAAARALGLRKSPPLLTVARTSEVAQPYWNCSCDRAKREIGFSPKVSLRDGARMTAEWYREQGWL